MEIEELKKEVTCAICQENYTEPKVLPCLHYYCKECILRLVSKAGGAKKPFDCPECRQTATLPDGGVDELRTAFFINRFKSKLNSLEIARGKVVARCEGCSSESEQAEGFCRQCAKFICGSCINAHQKMNKIFNGHIVASLADLRDGKASSDINVKIPSAKCEIHQKTLKVYCFDCNRVICRDCTMVNHKDHKFDFSSVAAPAKKEELLNDLEQLRRKKDRLTLAMATMQITKQKVEEQQQAISGKIRDALGDLVSSIKQCEKCLVEEAEESIQSKMQQLILQEDEVASQIAKTDKVIAYIETCSKYSSDNEIMGMHLEMKDRIKMELQKEMKIESVEVSSKAKNLLERSDTVLKDLRWIQSQISRMTFFPVQCLVEGEGLRTAEVDTTAEVTLNASLLSSLKTLDVDIAVKGQLRSLSNGSSITCKVSDRTPFDTYSIQYTPTNRGRHELLLFVDGRQILGSPFPVMVSISPSLLGKPIQVWKHLKSPISVAVTSLGELFVSEYDKNVVKMYQDGKIEVLLTKSSTGLKALRSIALDNADNVFCVDKYSSKIVRCDKQGGSLKIYEPQQVDGPGYWGLTVVDEEVLVCERNNASTILAYDKHEFQNKRRIEHCSKGEFIDISADKQDKLYVAENISAGSPFIRIFNYEGVLLQSFECSNGVKKPQDTHGICVSDPHVYIVCDCSVCVFTTTGQFVACFGQYGGKDGEFRGPRGVCMDSDYSLIVADMNNGRIQQF